MARPSKYKKLDQRTHCLERPGMYIGSVEPEDSDQWIWSGDRMVWKTVRIAPALKQVILEALTNCADHSLREAVTEIKIDVCAKTGRISIYNNGPGIDTWVLSESGPEDVTDQVADGPVTTTSVPGVVPTDPERAATCR